MIKEHDQIISTSKISAHRSNLILSLGLLLAIVLKVSLVLTQAVPFNSDEAIVALMARHILQGERPVFFYGQAFMGSLDAWLVAGAFSLLGECVFAIRVVQIVLYVLFLITSWLIARWVFQDRFMAGILVCAAAIPPILITTYTTATLGGYSETLVLGNLILLIGYQVTLGERRSSWQAWLGLGLVSGLAFWTHGLAVVYFLPIVIVGIWTFRKKHIPLYLLCLISFLIASSPWWYYNATQSGAAMAVFIQSTPSPSNLISRIAGLLALGIPTLLGFRPPWMPDYASIAVQLILLLMHFGAIVFLFINMHSNYIPIGRGWGALLGILVILFFILFVGTKFGLDATGRYLLPLYLPVVMLQTLLVGAAWKWRRCAGLALLGILLLVNGYETWRAFDSTAKITTQFDPITRFDNQYDEELISFLNKNGETRGYTNYWVSFRLAFLSGETLIYSAELPYKQDLRYSPRDNRYPAYSTAVAESSKVAYVTSLHPDLDRLLRKGLEEANVDHKEVDIGPYHVFYEISTPIRPAQLNLAP